MIRTVGGRTDHIVVIGAGLAGLSAALHLAGRGRRVTVVEREAVPGGRVGRIDTRGYALDSGPTVLTMTDIIDDTFAAVGEDRADRLIQRNQDLLAAAAEIRLQTCAKVAAARASLLQAQHAKERARTWLERALAFALRYQRPPR